MFRSPLKPSSGGPWPYFATLLNWNVDLHLLERVSVCGCMSVYSVCVCVWGGGYLSGLDYVMECAGGRVERRVCLYLCMKLSGKRFATGWMVRGSNPGGGKGFYLFQNQPRPALEIT
jgi:hypothetical protein